MFLKERGVEKIKNHRGITPWFSAANLYHSSRGQATLFGTLLFKIVT
jgi:hypothetical protein